MPRPKPSAQEKLLRSMETLFGASKEETNKLREQAKLTPSPDEIALEAEAVLLYFHTKGKDFIKQKCAYPKCNKTFAYKYHIPNVKLMCSNECRRASFAEIGIIWNPNKSPEERWEMPGSTKGIIPLIVPPAAYEIVESKLQESLEHNNSPVA